MTDASMLPPSRRAFLGQVAVAAAAGVAGTPSALFAASGAAGPGDAPAPRHASPPDDSWLDTLKGKHRQIFDMPQPAGGLPMLHVRNYLNTYADAYGVKHPDVNAVAGLYYMTIPLALNDAMWEKYHLGAAAKIDDRETGAAAVRNVFWQPSAGAKSLAVAGGPLALPLDTAMSELQKRGTLFIVCNNALNFWAGQVAQSTGQTPQAVRAEFDANLLPGMVVVPAMVIAFNQAQERGVTYMFLP